MTKDDLMEIIYESDNPATCKNIIGCNRNCEICAIKIVAEYENNIYNQALKDLSKKINETFWQFQGAEGSRNRLLLDKIVEDLKEGKEE